MDKVNISDLARQLSEKNLLGQLDAELFIRKMFDVVNEGLESDKQVKVKWFGTFKVQTVKDRESVDVNTGDRIVIEGRDKISFSPDNILKEIINKPFAQFETVVVNDGVDFDNIDKKFEKMDEENVSEQFVSGQPVLEQPLSEHPISEQPMDEEKLQVEKTDSLSEQESLSKENSSSRIVSVLSDAAAHLQSPLNSDIASEPEVTKSEDVEEKHVAAEVNDAEPTDVEGDDVEDDEVDGDAVEAEIPLDEEKSDIPIVTDKHHFVISRYVVVLAVMIVILLVTGLGYFAFSFGKMQAQRDALALQLKSHQLSQRSIPKKPVGSKPIIPSQEELSRKKALEDSIRLGKEAEAIKTAEMNEEKEKLSSETKVDLAANPKTVSSAQKRAEASVKKSAEEIVSSAKYEKDPRVRTGAYRIVGVQQVITAKSGQTLSVLSSRYLGPGMECYLEALNGSNPLKEGQKVKIPKLELKKKK